MIFTCQWNGPRMGRSLSYKRGGPDLNTSLAVAEIHHFVVCQPPINFKKKKKNMSLVY